MQQISRFFLILVLAGVFSACGNGSDPAPAGDDNFGLDDSSAYAGNHQASEDAEIEIKADQTLPAQFDLVATQTPVRNQASRGVCSIFGTVALMEHLYITEGTITEPDFSEQFLQWSSKVEGGSFPNSGGSNARSNLSAVNRFGVVTEGEWPYEPSPWGTAIDAACTGDNRPTRCYTNGAPPESALEARRYRLPRGRWVNNNAESIKSHMFNTNTAIQIGGDFFYQAWGHGRTNLGRYAPYRDAGYILMPNEADIADTAMNPAGHSYIAVGWDDELEVQEVDENGELAFDENGDPIMQRGFFLIKNSWGTDWATQNPFGAGYGWIAYEYVDRYLSAYASGLPEDVVVVEPCSTVEQCVNAECAMQPICVDPVDQYVNNTPVGIPDNDENGASSTIEVAEGGTISSVTVTVDIDHTWRGDLAAYVRFGGRSAQIAANTGGSEDNIKGTFELGQFEGLDSAGTWTLEVVDSASGDVGTINSWEIVITHCDMDNCGGMPNVATYTNDTLQVIPDNNGMGVSSAITVAETEAVRAARVSVNITHDYATDLEIYLSRGDQEVLVARELTQEGGVMQTFIVPDFNGESAAGEWTLRVADVASQDEGTLNSWTLELTL